MCKVCELKNNLDGLLPDQLTDPEIVHLLMWLLWTYKLSRRHSVELLASAAITISLAPESSNVLH